MLIDTKNCMCGHVARFWGVFAGHYSAGNHLPAYRSPLCMLSLGDKSYYCSTIINNSKQYATI